MSEDINVSSNPTTTTSTTDSTINSNDSGSNVSESQQQQIEEMIKLKVLGEEKEYPRSEVIKLAQLGIGANKKFDEVAKTRKQLEDVARNLVENPKQFLKNHPNRELILTTAQELLSEYVEEQEKLNSMSDSEKRAVELQKELDRRQKELDERDNQIKKHLTDHYREQFQRDIISALQNTELPVTEGSIIRIANLYKQALANGIQTTFDQCAKIVEHDYLGYLEDISRKRAKVEKQRNPKPRLVQNNTEPKKKMTMEEFQRELKRIK